MESDSTTQFALTFAPEEIELKPGTDAVLSARFFPLERDFVVRYSQSAKGRKRGKSDAIYGSESNSLEQISFFDEVRDLYEPSEELGLRIDALEERVRAYSFLIPQIFAVDSSFMESEKYCRNHGNGLGPALRGFYGPALEPGGSASLAMELVQCCKTIDSFYGDPRDGGKKVMELLDQAVETGNDEMGLEFIVPFRKALLRVLP